jgi:hypothetical protein
VASRMMGSFLVPFPVPACLNMSQCKWTAFVGDKLVAKHAGLLEYESSGTGHLQGKKGLSAVQAEPAFLWRCIQVLNAQDQHASHPFGAPGACARPIRDPVDQVNEF